MLSQVLASRPAGLAGYVIYDTQQLTSGLLTLNYLETISSKTSTTYIVATSAANNNTASLNFDLSTTKCVRPGFMQPGFNKSIINDETVRLLRGRTLLLRHVIRIVLQLRQTCHLGEMGSVAILIVLCHRSPYTVFSTKYTSG